MSGEPYRPSRPLEGAVTAEVAVLGGGFTGLATAYFLKRAEPSARVAVLDGEVVGFGASGRCGGFSTTQFGRGLSMTASMFGRERARQAHLYMEQAVELVERLILQNRIACDYERTGLLRVATSGSFARKVLEEVELAQALGLRGIEWLDGRATRRHVDSPRFQGAWWESRAALLNPAKLLRGMKALLEKAGVVFYERTPGIGIDRKLGKLFVRTPRGGVLAEKVALATNAYSHLIPALRHKQAPAFSHVVITDPLRPEQLDALRWQQRQAVEDARHLHRYFRLTADGRLLMGGRDISLSFGDGMEADDNAETYARLQADLAHFFPKLGRVSFSHSWGGPMSMTVQMAPALGFLGSERIVYSLGCTGHGLALGHMNGWTLSDLLRGERTERTDTFFVNRRVIPFPPEPFRLAMNFAVRALMRAEDAWHERFDASFEGPPTPLEPEPSPIRELRPTEAAARRANGPL
jgi:glycine/D-amino acid oxidase-like deaminating enzyme